MACVFQARGTVRVKKWKSVVHVQALECLRSPLALEHRPYRVGHVFFGEAEVLEQHGRGADSP